MTVTIIMGIVAYLAITAGTAWLGIREVRDVPADTMEIGFATVGVVLLALIWPVTATLLTSVLIAGRLVTANR